MNIIIFTSIENWNNSSTIPRLADSVRVFGSETFLIATFSSARSAVHVLEPGVLSFQLA